MAAGRPRYLILKTRGWLRSSDLSLIAIAVLVGGGAGLITGLIGAVSHELQHLLYGVGINRLSALGSIRHYWKLLALPAGGLLLAALYTLSARSRSAPIDVVEANALHGGRLPLLDSLWVCLQTIVSNGFGASVGLEAAYAQAGGGLGSSVSAALRLRRTDMRNLLGAGAGAAIAAAFAAPLTGAFYAFEVVIGAYTPAAIAPVVAAALAAALTSRALGVEPYLSVGLGSEQVTTSHYIMSALLGVICAIAAIAMMRLQGAVERGVAGTGLPAVWRPVVGGLLLIPLAIASPQTLSAGHGALRLDLAMHPALTFLALIFTIKAAASIISISFNFRGGLFFGSLFLGSLVGPAYAAAINAAAGHLVLSDLDASLVGMAAFAVSVVGAPMTLSLLVLETTNNFALTGLVITASLCASAFTRANFGYSFSTWRFHLRGSSIKSARDIGWTKALTASRLMRKDPIVLPASRTIGEFRKQVPLGSTSRILLCDPEGSYAGVVETARGYEPSLDTASPLSDIAFLQNEPIGLRADFAEILERFDELETEDLAVVDGSGRILGVVTEKYVHRRYIEESEKAHSEVFGERGRR